MPMAGVLEPGELLGPFQTILWFCVFYGTKWQENEMADKIQWLKRQTNIFVLCV